MGHTVLITGANRSIGLEFARQYAAEGWQVIATCRNPAQATDLQRVADENANVQMVALDIANPAQIEQISQQFSNTPIDHLINNAGIYGVRGENINTVAAESMLSTFSTNTIGTLHMCQAFLKQVAMSDHKLIVTLSTKVSSIADNQSGGSYSYRCSKTALNMLMKCIAIDVESQDVKVLILHPGWVKTPMGGPNALITVEQSVSGMREVIAKHGGHAQAEFYAYDGQTIPW